MGMVDGHNCKEKNRLFGHRNGTEAVHKVVEAAARLKIEHLTLYAFSTENWNRPKMEVSTLMDLLIRALRRELKKMIKNNIQLRSIGDISKLPMKLKKNCARPYKRQVKIRDLFSHLP